MVLPRMTPWSRTASMVFSGAVFIVFGATSSTTYRVSSYAAITALYRSREKISVTLTLMPSALTAVIAGSPAMVAGILINRLGRSTILDRSWACAMVAAVSCASRGSTSMDDVGAAGGEFTDLLLVGGAVLRAARKIEGLVVTPTMLESAISPLRLPDCRRWRDRSSNHIETPAADRSANGLLVACGVVM